MIVFLTEEPSMRVTLESLLGTALPDSVRGVDWLVISHEGKADLEKKLPGKMRSWSFGEPHFIILRDNDGGDCHTLKQRLLDLAAPTGKPHHVRIVCQELESWFLGDPDAIRIAYPESRIREGAAKLRDPDLLTNASDELRDLTGESAKVARAQLIAAHLDPARNRSASFRVLVRTIQELLA